MIRAGLPLIAAALLSACGPTGKHTPEADFAVLARAEPGFEEARPGHALRFPRDHGPHPDYRIEWWYLTANLEDSAGRMYGVQWTLFRTATEPPGSQAPGNAFQDPQVFMAHFAITTPERHVAFQRYARGGDHDGIARAGVTAAPFAAWMDDWSLESTGNTWLPLELRARQHPHAVSLRLDSDRPPVLHGDAGFSQKHPDGSGSYYYSQPFLAAKGELIVDGEPVAVHGQAWLDREWTSQYLQPDQAGWDWFALHLDSGEKLMLFRLRPADARRTSEAYTYAVLIDPGAGKRILDPERIAFEVRQTTPVAGRDLPLAWHIALPEIEREVTVEALHPNQWMDVDFPYWEGAVRVRGESPETSGVGYLELTGYPLRRWRGSGCRRFMLRFARRKGNKPLAPTCS